VQAVAGGKAGLEFAVGNLTGETHLYNMSTMKCFEKFPAGEI
jgi:hypothetical protein